MKRKYIIGSVGALLILAVLVSLKGGLFKTQESFEIYQEDGYYISEYGKMQKESWESMDHTNSGFDSPEAFLVEVDYYVEAISEYIDRPNWLEVYRNRHGENFEAKMLFNLTSRGSHSKGGYLQFQDLPLELMLGKSWIEADAAPIAHEITHLMTPFYSSLTLREGLASLMQDEIGKNPSIFNGGKPVHPLSKALLLKDHQDIIKVIGTEGRPSPFDVDIMNNIEKRKAFYIHSYSFSKYIIDEYGLDKFMEVYETEEKELYTKYKEVYGKELEELKQDWLDFLQEYKEA